MQPMRSCKRALCLGVVWLASGCLMPNDGTPVYVDAWAGEFWSGKGMLLEVSADQQRCRVAVRDRAGLVHRRWVACSSLHPRNGR